MNRFGFAPNVFERSEEMVSSLAQTGRVETEEATSPRPTVQGGSGLGPGSRETQVILAEGRNDRPDILREELLHAAQQELGGEEVASIIREVGGPENEALTKFAGVSVEEAYGDQPQEILADTLMAEMKAIDPVEEEEDDDVLRLGESVRETPQPGQVRIVREMFERAGNPLLQSLIGE